MESYDILSDKVKVCGPVFLVKVVGITVRIVSKTGDVV